MKIVIMNVKRNGQVCCKKIWKKKKKLKGIKYKLKDKQKNFKKHFRRLIKESMITIYKYFKIQKVEIKINTKLLNFQLSK